MGARQGEGFRFKSMRESFEENYKAVKVPADNRKGYRMDYQYIGNWMVWQNEEREVRKCRTFVLNACLISLILYVVAALQSVPVNYGRLVSLTGMLSLAPFVFEIFGAVQFFFSKDRMTEQSYTDILGKLRIAPFVHALLLTACAAIGAGQILLTGGERTQLLIPVCYLLSGFQSLLIIRSFSRLKARRTGNKD